nr:hypothetical protein [Tanacetum cinerariifolium]GEZ73728.1 hypothetical protein [Tanacetum cinerariifolium]
MHSTQTILGSSPSLQNPLISELHVGHLEIPFLNDMVLICDHIVEMVPHYQTMVPRDLPSYSTHTPRAASKWFKKDCIGSVTTWEDLVEKFVQEFYQLSDDNEETKDNESDDPNDIAEIFKAK